MSLGQVFVNQMKAAGIDAQLQGTSVNSWTSDVTNGNYQLSFCGVWATDGPYTTFDTLLASSAGAPVGKAAISNVSRFSNPKVDSLLAKYRRSGDVATQRKAIAGIATIIGQQAPIIPLMSVTSFGAYTTKRFTGWPSSANPYQTDAILNPYTEDVILHLKPAA
jgi:peptide/nickel transport system substrate-binding protein